MIQSVVHYGIHFVIPVIVALLFFKSNWKIAYLIMMATMVIDLDHLLAIPIFNTNRCSINFHPLHSYIAIAIYLILPFFKRTRLIGLGLMIHILADTADCLFM